VIDRRALMLAAAASVVAAGASAQTPPRVATDANGRPLSHPMVERRVPAFSAERATGGTFSQANLTGKWTVLDFWGIWCSDCMRDAPYTEALARAIAVDPAMQFIGVHVDKRYARWDSVAAYLREKGVTYPVLLDPEKNLYRAFEMQWVPTYLVIDPQGVVRGFRTDLSADGAPEGGVKAFMQDIARLRGARRA
jgi:thiol-disulfide isomerase/thioredoxin